jgi:hypothetical protein
MNAQVNSKVMDWTEWILIPAAVLLLVALHRLELLVIVVPLTFLAAYAVVEPDPLTDHERQVLRLAGDGMASFDIAGKLNCPKGQSGTTSQRPSANLRRQTAWKPRASREPRGGCRRQRNRTEIVRGLVAASGPALGNFEAEPLKDLRSFFAAKIRFKLHRQSLVLGRTEDDASLLNG